MLFNSFEFIFVYLPLTLAVFFALGRVSMRAAASWLGAASLFFYGWWNPQDAWLLVASIVGNYLVGAAVARRPVGARGRTALTALGVGSNLALLGYFKYANLLVATLASVSGMDWAIDRIILPIGISFFTFTQIAYLIDCQKGLVQEYSFHRYFLFVTFMPHLVAGPILHHKEMMPQFAEAETYRPRWDNFAIGLTIFAIGLFKKVVLADSVAVYASPLFEAAEAGARPDFFTAWGGALAYTCQLYFDFSAYSDMAIGIARLFGIRLPLNFNSPYKSLNIIDFWRRWHITLSRWLRDYLYIPLGGNRNGSVRRHVNLMLTMALGGLWHGASWTFLLWGILHGGYLIVNHFWRALTPEHWRSIRLYQGVAWAVTFIAVVMAWVPFRATSFAGAERILTGMLGGHGVTLPSALHSVLAAHVPLEALGIGAAMGGGALFVETWGWVLALLAVALFLPNTQQVMAAYRPALERVTDEVRFWRWQPSRPWAIGTAVILVLGLLSLTRVSQFLYFQF